MKKKLFAGTMVTVFLATIVFIAIPVQVSASSPTNIEIGIIGPKGWIQWDGLWDGARIARDLINTLGMGNTGDQVVLVDIDEHSVPYPDPASARIEVKKALDTHPTLRWLVGGFRTECVEPMREEVADYFAAHNRPIWMIAGAATDSLITVVASNYARYKFLFRVTPMNSTALFTTFGAGAIRQLIVPKLLEMYGGPQVKFYVIAENLEWCNSMVAALTTPAIYNAVLGPNVTNVGSTRPSATESNFGPIITGVPADAHLVIHIFSAVAGRAYIATYGTMQPKFLTVGINVESQRQEFCAEIGGLCNYETMLVSTGTRINVNPNAKPLSTVQFWDLYSSTFKRSPIYTAWGAYDAICSLNETYSQWIGNWTTGNMANCVPYVEATVRSGILGNFKYTGAGGVKHDVWTAADSVLPIWPSGFVRAHIVQWQDCNMVDVLPCDQAYSRKLLIPPWMYSLSETDFAGVVTYPWLVPPYNIPGVAPDGTVDATDLGQVAAYWFSVPPWYTLETDMTPQDHFINVYDVAKVALDSGKSHTGGDPTFP